MHPARNPSPDADDKDANPHACRASDLPPKCEAELIPVLLSHVSADDGQLAMREAGTNQRHERVGIVEIVITPEKAVPGIVAILGKPACRFVRGFGETVKGVEQIAEEN